MPEDFKEQDEKIKTGFQLKFIQEIVKIGEVRSLGMNIYEITHQSENDPRISLSRDSFRLLAHYGIKRALILFASQNSPNYRLSLVTIDLKWEEGKRVQKEYSNPRRYSFFLGPETKTHTPETYLIKKGRVKDFDDLKERFSLEIVNKDFYTQIAILFTKLAGGKRTIGKKQFEEQGSLQLPSTSDDTIKKEFSVRLIGRLIFCWFLKKKTSDRGVSLIPEGFLSSNSIAQCLNFYHDVLEPLFFETLNKPLKQRKKEYQIPPWSQIPFLNGGLFMPEYHDYYQVDSLGTSKYINILKVSNNWLKELFEVFETYNFTIDENTPVDVELSIEPEMLGRIFENLLAEINPETGNTARKSTGSYYTPRPIVEYMVDESLKQYLLAKTNLDGNKISSLLAYEEEEAGLSEPEKDVVIDALDAIKIIDPACGSGAFPMGILQKMLLILQKIDPESKKWLNKKVSQIENSVVREEFQKKIEAENWNYVHKLGIIQNSIYGVDIQPIAVDISKLRFFLSLIVDEKVDDLKENRGIDSLPNLEFKFVCANSLIGLPNTLVGSYKKGLQPKLFEEVGNINELRKLREEYLRCYGDEKILIEKKFQEIQSEMFLNSLNWGGEESQTVKLSQWNPFSGESCAWFNPEWMFGIKDGFDIVIGNPPYIEFKRISKEDKKKYKFFKTAKGKYDIYVLFIKLSKELLSTNGYVVYITSTTFMKKDFGRSIRSFIIDNFSIKKIFDFADIQVFENSTNYTGIFIFQKTTNKSIFVYNKYFLINRLINIEDFEKSLLSEKKTYFRDVINVDMSTLLTDNWNFQMPIIEKIIKKVYNGSQFLSFYVERIFEGIASGKDEVFYISEKKLNELQLERGLLFPILKGKDIKRYKIDWSGFYVIYPYKDDSSVFPEKELRERCPNIFHYLTANKKLLNGRDYFDNSSKLWYELWNQRKKVNFKKIRLVCPEISDKNNFTITNIYFGNTKTYHIVLQDKKKENYFYFLGLLNSSLIDFVYKTITTPHAGGFYAYKTQFLNRIPIKKDISFKKKSDIALLVRKILQVISENRSHQTIKQEKVDQCQYQIDQMVYKLYDLSDDEIESVENFHKKV
ncbi:MAG: TaqI-like C-terminal specificity domain-containing protein [Atribacterota bacterium]|nr:TaqI-like C-terminal specificity domain-containing protein [Atribacterota bacterium]